ncbi:MAG: PD-(D/E)XK nuclease family protein [Solirubrobacteraceae bacterium]
MPITLITGPANAGKARVVMDAVRGHLAHGEEPLLVVPTLADADLYRRELAGEGAVMGVDVERFDGLISEAVRRAGVGMPVLAGLARERALAGIAAREAPASAIGTGRAPGGRGADGVPGAEDDAGIGFVRALAAFLAELQVRRVTPGRLSGALARWADADGAGAFAGQVGRLFEAYHRTLSELGLLDEEQRAVRALDALRRSPALWGATPVLFYGFDDFTRLQLDAIETLGVVVGAKVTVSLTYEPGRVAFAGRAGTFQALAPLAAEHRQLPANAEYYAPGARAALSHLERSLFEPEAARVEAGGAVRLLEGGGERAELELVAREIAALLDQGMTPGEIAVVLRAPAVAADLLEEVLSAARIPYALQRRRRFADTATGRALIGLLRCVPAPTGGGEAGDLLAWLRAPGLLEHPELADRLEASVRRRGILSAEQARALWEQKHWPLDTIDHLRDAAERGAAALIDRAGRELEWLLTAPRRGQASVFEREELDEARALAAGRRALAELAELARAAPALAPGDASGLAKVLAEVEFLSGEPPGPGSVAVLDPLALRARRVRALFLCRLQEGAFPAPARPAPFLAEEERRRLAELSGLRLIEQEDALAAERYLLYAAVSRPEELLVLSWHTSSDDGMAATASLFVEDVSDLFDGSLSEERVRRELGAVGWTGCAGALPAPPRTGPAATGSPPAPERLGPLHDEELLADLRAHTWSASSLEVWMSCPVRWLVERMLRAEGLDPDPEPLARGGLAHAALKDTFEGLRRETGAATLIPRKLALARELLGNALRENAPDFPLSAAPERRPGLRRRLEADLERYLEHAAAAAAQGCDGVRPLEPTHLELGFGFAAQEELAAGADLPAFDLGGGVMLRGRIDRVDVGEGGEAVVYDYKGRSASPAAKWIGESDLQVALYMRAIEDLLGLRAVGGFYQPLAGRDLRARGVLDGDSGVQIDCVGADLREREEVRALLDQACAAAREAAAQAGRGEIRARPQTCAFKGGCMYPTICGCER